ncbi:MAG: MFS transporter [Planctomycetota bacterium]|nr:MFS transporter [Planctomycetota bacterium]
MVTQLFKTYRDAYAGLPREIWLLSLIMMINRSGTMVLLFFVLYLTDVFGFSNQTAGAIMSFSAVGGILGALAGGWASDRFGAIRAQIVFLGLVSFHFLLMLYAKSLTQITAALFVMMFLNEAVRPGLHAACFQYSEPDNQKRSMGLLRLAINLGMAIGPVVGGFLAEYELWNWLFILDALTCLVSAVLLCTVFGWRGQSPTQHPTKKGDEEEDHPSDRLDLQPAAGTGSQSPWTDRRMLRFGVFFLMPLLVFVQLFSSFIKYLQDVYGFSESEIGWVNAINPILIVAFEMIIIRKLENQSTLKTVAAGTLLICIGFGLLPFGSTLWFCVLTVLIWSIGEILAFPLAAVYVAELSTQANRGRYMSFITVLFSISMVVGPVVGMSLYDYNRDLPWYLALLAGLISFSGLWILANGKQGFQRGPEPQTEE